MRGIAKWDKERDNLEENLGTRKNHRKEGTFSKGQQEKETILSALMKTIILA